MKLGKMISNKLLAKQEQQEQLQELQMLQEEEKEMLQNGNNHYLDFLKETDENGHSNGHKQNGKHQNGKHAEDGEDIVMTINKMQKKKKNKKKKQPE